VTTTDVQMYEFPDDGAQIRVTVVDDEPWFYAADVCRVLGVKDVSMALSRLDEADTSSTGVRSGGQMRRIKVVNESGLYDLILSSRKPEARKFRRWVTSDVLPTIRKTGGYGTVPALPDITTPDGVLAMAEQLVLTARSNVELTAELEAAKPKVDAFDATMSSGGHLNMGEVAKTLGTGRDRLFRFLRDRGVLMNAPGVRDHHNVPYQRYMRYFHVATKRQVTAWGESFIVATTYVKPQGVEFIRRMMSQPA